MRFVAGRFVAGLLLTTFLFGNGVLCSAQGTSEKGADALPPLKWAADSEGGAPYIFLDPKDTNHYIGFEVDLAEALGKELGRRIEYVQYEFKSLVPGLQRGDFDFAMNGLEITPDRAKVIRFSKPYYIYALQLVVRADDNRFTTLEECKKLGGVVGTLEDTAAARLLEQMGITTRTFGNQVEPFRDLEYGRLDAVLLDLPIAMYYAKPNDKLKFVGDTVGVGQYAIGFRKGQEALAQQVDAALDRLQASGKLQKIYEKWRIWNDDQKALGDPNAIENVVNESKRNWTLSYYFPKLWAGAKITIQLTVTSMLVAMILGLCIALLRLYGPRPIQLLAMLYVEFFRGIPVLLLLFFLYYGLPEIAHTHNWRFSLELQPLQAAILGFGLNYAAYQAEIFRAGISSIPLGQWEAGASLGMTQLHTFRRIILPQAVRVILPPTTNDFVALFKDTSIVSIIAVEELTKQYQILAKSSTMYLEIGFVTAMLYLMMSVPLGYLSRYLERRWGKGR
jgi:polar amino acid transport system substrate-binding protein